jgi:hypothetical protein
MRKALALVLVMLTMAMPFALAESFGTSIVIGGLTTEPFSPSIWKCGAWVMTDDPLENGRISGNGELLVERTASYIFTGERLAVDVLVLDKNGIDKVQDIYVSVNGSIEANCQKTYTYAMGETLPTTCNARLGEEVFTNAIGNNVMAMYRCTFTAEPQLHGNQPIVATVLDQSGRTGTTTEVLHFFFNPAVNIGISGPLNFGTVRPGTQATSPTVLITSNSEGGVKLDLFIAGRDFYDSSHSGAMCPTTNSLALSNFAYYATHGAYSTATDPRRVDAAGYVPIKYCDGAECNFNPGTYYNQREIMQVQLVSPYYAANVLESGSSISMTFRVSMPLPCNGNFAQGTISIAAEAI